MTVVSAANLLPVFRGIALESTHNGCCNTELPMVLEHKCVELSRDNDVGIPEFVRACTMCSLRNVAPFLCRL